MRTCERQREVPKCVLSRTLGICTGYKLEEDYEVPIAGFPGKDPQNLFMTHVNQSLCSPEAPSTV